MSSALSQVIENYKQIVSFKYYSFNTSDLEMPEFDKMIEWCHISLGPERLRWQYLSYQNIDGDIGDLFGFKTKGDKMLFDLRWT